MSHYPENSTAKEYFDSDGKPTTLYRLVRQEPEWAQSRVQAGELAITERDTYRDLCGELLEALRAARIFIGNGIELGYIRMPDRDTPDAAHKTPAIVRSAITKAEKILGASWTK